MKGEFCWLLFFWYGKALNFESYGLVAIWSNGVWSYKKLPNVPILCPFQVLAAHTFLIIRDRLQAVECFENSETFRLLNRHLKNYRPPNALPGFGILQQLLLCMFLTPGTKKKLLNFIGNHFSLWSFTRYYQVFIKSRKKVSISQFIVPELPGRAPTTLIHLRPSNLHLYPTCFYSLVNVT